MSENNSAKSSKGTLVKDALILFAITVIAAVALGYVYEITKAPIAEAQLERTNAAYRKVFKELVSVSDSEEFNGEVADGNALIEQDEQLTGTKIEQIAGALDDNGNLLGYVFTVSNAKGYGGEITAVIGIGLDGTLKGVEFLSISETPGLGMKAKEEAFTEQFSDVKTESFSFNKGGITGEREIDAISSATITSRAVTRMINGALKVFTQNLAKGGAD